MKRIRVLSIIVLFGVFFSLSAAAPVEIPTEEEFFKIIRTQSIEKAVKIFRDVRQKNPKAVIFRERALNRLGYEYLIEGKIEDTLKIFKLNIEAYPESFNVYDSYGEVLLLQGDTAQSIINYEKSLEINPDNTNAVEILERINKK